MACEVKNNGEARTKLMYKLAHWVVHRAIKKIEADGRKEEDKGKRKKSESKYRIHFHVNGPCLKSGCRLKQVPICQRDGSKGCKFGEKCTSNTKYIKMGGKSPLTECPAPKIHWHVREIGMIN